MVRLMSGNMAAVISVSACYPLEVLKTRMQIQVNYYLLTLLQGQMENGGEYGVRSLKKVLREEGYRGLYRGIALFKRSYYIMYIGYSISLFCTPLFHSLYFPLYEQCKLHFKERNGWDENSLRLYAVSAGISGLFCNIVTNPLWVVRTRMQGEIFRSASNEHYKRMYKGIFHSLLKIGQEVRKLLVISFKEGVRALFTGLTASIIGISHAMIYFPIYEHQKMFFKKKFEPESPDKPLSSHYIFLSAIISKCKNNNLKGIVASSAMTYPH